MAGSAIIITAMAILFLTAFDQQVNEHTFSCELPSIEAQFDFLNSLVAQGHTLSRAYLIEDERRTDLPLAAFDGLPTTAVIQALEKEWQAILSSPRLVEEVHQRELIELTQRRIKHYKATIRTHQQMIDRYRHWIQRIQASSPRSTNTSWLLGHYQTQVVAHQARLDAVRVRANWATHRLSQLMA